MYCAHSANSEENDKLEAMDPLYDTIPNSDPAKVQTKAVTAQAHKRAYLHDKLHEDIEPFYSSVQNDMSTDVMDEVQTDNKL